LILDLTFLIQLDAMTSNIVGCDGGVTITGNRRSQDTEHLSGRSKRLESSAIFQLLTFGWRERHNFVKMYF
jgi:hypothetical protein